MPTLKSFKHVSFLPKEKSLCMHAVYGSWLRETMNDQDAGATPVQGQSTGDVVHGHGTEGTHSPSPSRPRSRLKPLPQEIETGTRSRQESPSRPETYTGPALATLKMDAEESRVEKERRELPDPKKAEAPFPYRDWKVEVTIVSADHLPKSDILGKTDPYCKCTCGDVEHTTETRKKTYNPVWNELVCLRVARNALKPVKFVLFDHDIAGSDDEIGEVELCVDTMQKLLSAQHGMVQEKAYKLMLAGKIVIGEDEKEAELVVKVRAFPYLHIPEPHKSQATVAAKGLEASSVGGGPLGYPWNDLQQYYLDARKADRQQNENMKSLQGILEAVTQSTRFVTAELWNLHGSNDAVGSGNKVSPQPFDKGTDLESGEGEFGIHLKFSGQRATIGSFLSHAAAGQLGAKAKEYYDKIDKLAEHAVCHVGEGLEGEALERGGAEFNVLADYIKNPERQVSERAKLASSLYSASLAMPIRASHDPHSPIVAMLMLYLPADSGCPPLEYVDKHKTPVMSYVEQTAKILSLELLKQDALTEYHRLRLSIKYTVTERARQIWSRCRVTVKMGALSSKKASPPLPPSTPLSRAQKWLKNYAAKWKGANSTPPPRADWTNCAWTFIGVFVGILVPSLINHFALALNDSEFILMMGSFGALATLLYAAPASPFAQPRMVMMGHLVALIISISIDYFVINSLTDGKPTMVPTNTTGTYQLTAVEDVNDFSSSAFLPKWLAVALVPALSISAMAKLGCINPPAAAASIIYQAGNAKVKKLQWLYVFMPTLVGCSIMIAVAILVNNMSARRKYPQFW